MGREGRLTGRGFLHREDAMKKEQMPRYALALAVLVVGLAFAGVPLSTLLVLPLVLACPLMMMFMMRGMNHGSGGGCGHDHSSDPSRDQHEDTTRDHHPVR
jgi:hypothetical protein